MKVGLFVGLDNINILNKSGYRVYNPKDHKRFQRLLTSDDRDNGSVTHKSYIFTDYYKLPKYDDISQDAKRSITVDNAGGKSEISELYSIDYFIKIYRGNNVILEEEVSYWIDYKMVDFICSINGNRVGVSVARAMGFPTSQDFTYQSAEKLLRKKLYGLIVARNAVVKEQSFYKSILHIWCQSEKIANNLQMAFSNLDDNDYGLDIKGVLILQLTVCDDMQLYKNFLNHI